ncbi:MAG TPA: cold shock domain-containing protein [Flavobacteriaceae bacterium]|nr:cold shock domain-containing protein [Flavobacteriaceae bacterium]
MLKRFISRIFNSKEASVTREGTVKFFNETRGFGFIKVSDTEDDIFVHATNLVDRIRENDQVQFNVEQGKKGPSAINVRKL